MARTVYRVARHHRVHGPSSIPTDRRQSRVRLTPALPAATEDPPLERGALARERSLLVPWRPPTIPQPRGPQRTDKDPSQQLRQALPTLVCVDQEREIPRGTQAFLMATGQNPGLVARGRVRCRPFLAARTDRVGTVGQHVIVAWVEVIAIPKAVPIEVLRAWIPDWNWSPADGSAAPLPAELTSRVDRVWNQWMQRQQSGQVTARTPRRRPVT